MWGVPVSHRGRPGSTEVVHRPLMALERDILTRNLQPRCTYETATHLVAPGRVRRTVKGSRYIVAVEERDDSGLMHTSEGGSTSTGPAAPAEATTSRITSEMKSTADNTNVSAAAAAVAPPSGTATADAKASADVASTASTAQHTASSETSKTVLADTDAGGTATAGKSVAESGGAQASTPATDPLPKGAATNASGGGGDAAAASATTTATSQPASSSTGAATVPMAATMGAESTQPTSKAMMPAVSAEPPPAKPKRGPAGADSGASVGEPLQEVPEQSETRVAHSASVGDGERALLCYHSRVRPTDTFCCDCGDAISSEPECVHQHALPGDRYCSECGEELRWSCTSSKNHAAGSAATMLMRSQHLRRSDAVSRAPLGLQEEELPPPRPRLGHSWADCTCGNFMYPWKGSLPGTLQCSCW